MQHIESLPQVERIRCNACNTIYFDRDPQTPPRYDKAYNLHFFRPGDIRKAGIMAAKLAELIDGKWPHPNILEVGAGNGLTVMLLRCMELNAFGLDIDPKLSQHLMLSFKIPVIPIRFEEFNPPGKYHLIYSSHVIEHSMRPREFLKKGFDLLEPGGYFYIDTPDTGCRDQDGPRWHHFETRNPYEHCCLLNPVGLRIMAEEIGFKTTKIDRYHDFGSMQALLIKS
jgi:2-polyprenyl-3-methyl-5-hydroxy-6-metoxy-1,4-benzoquinol methylase